MWVGNGLLEVSPVALAEGVHVAQLLLHQLVRQPPVRQQVESGGIVEFLSGHNGHLVLVLYIVQWATLGKHQLSDIELMVVQGVVARGNHFKSSFDAVAVEVHEQSAEGDVVGWHMSKKP